MLKLTQHPLIRKPMTAGPTAAVLSRFARMSQAPNTGNSLNPSGRAAGVPTVSVAYLGRGKARQ